MKTESSPALDQLKRDLRQAKAILKAKVLIGTKEQIEAFRQKVAAIESGIKAVEEKGAS